MSCEIFVKHIPSKTTRVCVDSEEELKNMTVKELIRRFCPDHPYDKCRLFYEGRELDHDRTLGYYGVSNKSTMYMIIHMRGGGPGPPPDEDNEVPRSLSDMQQEESSGCCIM